MKKIIRKTLDKHLGHFCENFEQTNFVSGSEDVFINDFSVVRKGDYTECLDIAVEGSESVFVNNKPVNRNLDKTSGHGCYPPNYSIGGSDTVISG